MHTEIFREITFESAHRLPHVPDGHKCGRLHGHSYRARVWVRGELGVLREKLEPVRLALDHRYLNEIEGLQNPTSENVARWMWERLAPSLPGLVRIEIMETCTSGVRYEGG
jgi:6-pyruvoyltetrahydropterin/6-carboxytetrahydropterin synthase